MVRALAHAALGQDDAAHEDLGQALSRGLPAGYVRLFLDEGPGRWRSCSARTRRRVPAELRRGPARTVAPTATPTPPPPAPSETLSEREVEVLRLLATELTGPEIARRLFVSVNTLRTHTRHIFTKLDVNTRRAAVARAAALGPPLTA